MSSSLALYEIDRTPRWEIKKFNTPGINYQYGGGKFAGLKIRTGEKTLAVE